MNSALSHSPSIDQLVKNLFEDSMSEHRRVSKESTDSDIVQSIVRGYRENYTFIVEKYYNPIYNYLLRSLNFHKELSEDLSSETFFKAYLNLNRYRKNAKFSSWLYRIAHNVLIDYYRSAKGSNQSIDTITDDASSLEIAQKLTYDATSASVDSKELLEPILNALSREDKELLTLFYLDELSIQEIASIFDVFPGTIKTRLHRARKKAKNLVTRHSGSQKNKEIKLLEKMEMFLNNFSKNKQHQ